MAKRTREEEGNDQVITVEEGEKKREVGKKRGQRSPSTAQNREVSASLCLDEKGPIETENEVPSLNSQFRPREPDLETSQSE